jgi:hypothetical protein
MSVVSHPLRRANSLFFAVVAQLAKELEARRLARARNVIAIDTTARGRRR